MLMIRHAASAIASSAARTEWIDSSRQIGVAIRRCSVRVIADVVVLERLLDHHQVEAVERGEVVGIGERVRGVRVDHQRNVAEARADRLDRRDVPARLDLDLDAAVAGVELLPDLGRQLVERVLDADRHAGGDLGARAAEQPRQRHVPRSAPPDPTPPSRPPPSPCCGRARAPATGTRRADRANVRPSTSGARKSLITCHAVTLVSAL